MSGEGEFIEFKHWFCNNFDWTSLLEQISAWLENGSGINKKENAKNHLLGPIYESTQSKYPAMITNYYKIDQLAIIDTFQFIWCKWS